VNPYRYSSISPEAESTGLGRGTKIRLTGRALVGLSEGRSRRDVPRTVIGRAFLYRAGDTAFWRDIERLYPMPRGKKPVTRTKALHNWRGRLLVTRVYSNTWRNPVNAQAKRRNYHRNLTKRLEGETAVYERIVGAESWDEHHHDALTKRILRHGGKWAGFNCDTKYRYLANVQLPGFELVRDLQTTLHQALSGIHPPRPKLCEADRFRPIVGSPEWVDGADEAPWSAQGEWKVLADSEETWETMRSKLLALTHEHRNYELPAFWRGQVGKGLVIEIGHAEAADVLLKAGMTLNWRGWDAILHTLSDKLTSGWGGEGDVVR